MGDIDRYVVWTAELIRHGCDVARNHEAEPCERGYVDPDWSVTSIDHVEHDDAARFRPDPDDDPVQWLANHVRNAIGTAEKSGAWGTWYGAPFDSDGYEVTLAAHAHGFTDDEIQGANALITGVVS